MRDTSTRVFSLMCALVGVWVVVYWVYEPARPPVTFDTSAPRAGEPPIRPDPLAQLDRDNRPRTAVPSERGSSEQSPRPSAARADAPPSRAPTDRSPPAGDSTRAVPPAFKEYVVERGDTFEVIARKLLGDSRHWKSIAAANAFVDPRRLVPGRTVLRIPIDPDNVEGRVVPIVERPAPRQSPPDAGADAPAVPSQPPAPAPDASFTQYVIKDSDTLSSIAKDFYGKAAAWRAIFDANRDVIADPDHLKPGSTIRVPRQP